MTANGVAAWIDPEGDGIAVATLNSASGSVADDSVTTTKIADGAIINADINASAAIALSKLASDPLARANHTGTQTLSTISDAGSLAALSAVASAQITDGTIVGGDLSSTIAIPSAATGTTQSAADSSTKLATTAFVTTADNLKANLAGPTFTGTVTLPSTTVAVTPSASDNSTKPATTAYVDTADALKANLASPTFTGTVVLPSSTVTSAMIVDATIVTGDIAAATIRESNFNTSAWTANDLNLKAWNGDPLYTSANPTFTSKTVYVSKLKVPVATTCTSINVSINTIGSTLTTIATATVNGLQTAPGSGAWTLTTSSMSGYSAAGIATIGSTIVAYSAWSGTSMTVQAGGYTPGATFSNTATITANSNCVALFDSTGAFLGACVDQTASGFVGSNVYTVFTMIPATPAIAAGTCYVAYIGTGTTPAKLQCFAAGSGCGNPGPTALLTGANSRWGSAGTAQNSMPSVFTPSAIGATTVSPWFGLG